jgi:hypothetical protein
MAKKTVAASNQRPMTKYIVCLRARRQGSQTVDRYCVVEALEFGVNHRGDIVFSAESANGRVKTVAVFADGTWTTVEIAPETPAPVARDNEVTQTGGG